MSIWTRNGKFFRSPRSILVNVTCLSIVFNLGNLSDMRGWNWDYFLFLGAVVVLIEYNFFDGDKNPNEIMLKKRDRRWLSDRLSRPTYKGAR